MFEGLVTVLTYMAVVLVVLVAIIMLLAYRFRHFQDMIVYHPEEPAGARTNVESPRDKGVSRYELLEIRTPDGVTLRGFLVQPARGTPRCVITYFHGNAGNVGHRIPIACMLAEGLSATVVMVDYRGFGLSDGGSMTAAPHEAGLKIDADAIMDFVLNRDDLRRLPQFVMGTSLGGAVTAYLGSQPRFDSIVAGFIIENSFTSISDMADALFAPMIAQRVPGWRGRLLIFTLSRIIKPIVLYIGWWSIDAVRHITAPTMFISSAKDELVPPAHVQALHDAAVKSSLRRFVVLPQGTHNDAPNAPGYLEHITSFIHDALRRRGHHLGTGPS
jgi:pimeloyl-ACP methyl ester carboxylesterase